MSLHERLAQDLGREAGCLVVHLHRGDALGGSADLEVHVTKEVLDALNVGKDYRLALLLDETHGNAGNGTNERNARIHERERGATR